MASGAHESVASETSVTVSEEVKPNADSADEPWRIGRGFAVGGVVSPGQVIPGAGAGGGGALPPVLPPRPADRVTSDPTGCVSDPWAVPNQLPPDTESIVNSSL